MVRDAFAELDPRIDPPSSANRLDERAIREAARSGEVWVLGAPPEACVTFTFAGDHLYLGKLAVHPGHRRRGLARALLLHAVERAAAHGLPRVVLQSRVELVENHALFRACGFRAVGETRHPGFDRATSLTFERAVAPVLPA